MKRQQPKLMNLIFIIFLYIITAVLFIYGIYSVKCSLDYIDSYQNNSYITNHNIIQYVAESSIIYFAAGFITLIGAVILTTLNRLQKNIYEIVSQLNSNRMANSYDYNDYSVIDGGQQIEIPLNDMSRRKRRH